MLSRRLEKLTSILEVAKAMTVQTDLDALLALILLEAKQVVDADRCTIYVLDPDSDTLWSRLAQGLETREIRLPLGQGIAGTVALHNQVVNIADAYQDDRFDRAVDEVTGYRTGSILAAPMRGTRGDVVGVIQALNRLDERPFDAEDEELLMALGGQAASAIQNAMLHEAIEVLFESFIRASVTAIEARDPVTSGHSERVARLSVALAEAVNRAESGPYAEVRFSPQDLRELRYAALLHDFGKVGVPEAVLVKENKLQPWQIEQLRLRFALARAGLERDHYRRRAEIREAGRAAEAPPDEGERDLRAQLDLLDQSWRFIERCNRPELRQEEDTCERLRQIGGLQVPAEQGMEPLLTEREIELLSIPRGSLAADERQEMEHHVVHTFRYLRSIPWTKNLCRIPEIAHAHHERLDGNGYPQALRGDQIPLGSRIMAIADIYDALTAHDRPYKPAMSHQAAIGVLAEEAARGLIDADLLVLFIGSITE
ncbi:MAG: GAF domain-containing protein [Bradymonadales bacterium]|nr:GAF domain-containing protein [Bradymonadales bacterium]